jgi:hypothetical protein
VKIPDGMTVLFRGKAAMLREIAQVLEAGELKVATGAVPGGWEPQGWLAVASTDAARAMALHRAHLERMVRKEGLPVRDVVADFDAEEAQCPACLTKFKTAGVSRCPDCGLNFR